MQRQLDETKLRYKVLAISLYVSQSFQIGEKQTFIQAGLFGILWTERGGWRSSLFSSSPVLNSKVINIIATKLGRNN